MYSTLDTLGVRWLYALQRVCYNKFQFDKQHIPWPVLESMVEICWASNPNSSRYPDRLEFLTEFL